MEIQTKLLSLILITLFSIQNLFAYIDPGTGGYLISSIWSYIVTFVVIIFGYILNFFKHTLKNLFIKHKLISISLLSITIIFSAVLINIYLNSNSGSQLTLPPYDESLNGVQIYNKNLVSEGYNLYEGKLIDMDGKLIKTWNYSYLSILDEKGYYYAQKSYESLGWGKFDWNDNPIWIKKIPIHHEIYLTDYDTIITLTKEVKNYNNRLVEFDVVLEFDSNGTLISNWSTYDSLELLQQFHRPLELDNKNQIIPEDHKKNTSIWGANYDYYHLNAISLIPDNSKQNLHKAFTKGNWILSFRHGSMIFILDKDTKEPLWSGIYDQIEENIEGQHAPQMLENGNILIFDNGRYRHWSRIIEVNPATMKIESEYKSEDFFTYSQGYVQVLPNKNLLITESEDGRIFELKINPNTKQSEIVWEYYVSESMEHDEFGTIRDDVYRVTRYPKTQIDNIITKWE